MTLQTHFQLHASGLALVAQAAGVSKTQMVAWGATPDEADQMLALWAAYYGKTPYPGLQKKARKTTHGLADLLRIEKHVAKAAKFHAREAAKLRAQLATTPAAKIDDVAREIIDALTPEKEVEMGYTLRRFKDYTLANMKLPPLFGEELSQAFGGDKGTVEAVKKVFKGKIGETTVRLNAIIPLDYSLNLCSTNVNGGQEVLFRTTEGVTLTGAELLNAKCEDAGMILAVHPVHGKINLYQSQRMANLKQRVAAKMMNPTCSWEGCTRPAVVCQINHVKAAKNGGETNMNNLVTACAYHNGINDDDRTGFYKDGTPTRGYMDIQAGVGGRRAFPGAPLKFNENSYKFPPLPPDAGPPPGPPPDWEPVPAGAPPGPPPGPPPG